MLLDFLLDYELFGAAAGEHSTVLLDFEGLEDEFGIDAGGYEVFLELFETQSAPLVLHAFYYNNIIGENR